MSDTDAILRAIHATHVRCTGLESTYLVHEGSLFLYREAGYTADDMEMVLKYLKRENGRNTFKINVAFGRLISDLQRFDDFRALARGVLRNTVKPATPREVVLTQLRGPATTETETGTARTIKDVLKGIQ